MFYDEVLYMMGKVLSGELSSMWTGLITKGNNLYDSLFASLRL